MERAAAISIFVGLLLLELLGSWSGFVSLIDSLNHYGSAGKMTAGILTSPIVRLALISVGLVLAIRKPKDLAPKGTRANPLTISPKELVSEYGQITNAHADERLMAKYGGKFLRVSGPIANISSLGAVGWMVAIEVEGVTVILFCRPWRRHANPKHLHKDDVASFVGRIDGGSFRGLSLGGCTLTD